MSELGLHISNLTVRYGKALAVRGVDLDVEKGSLIAIVGPNGAGKSSLFQAIQGVVKSDADALDVGGVSLLRKRSTQRARSGVVMVPQGHSTFPRLSVADNLRVIADGLGLPKSRVGKALDRFPILREREKALAGVLSGGERQMLVLARALMSDPQILLLDEPTQGLAPVIVSQVVEAISRLRTEGRTVLVAEPTTRTLPPNLDRGLVLVNGRLTADEATLADLESAYHRQFEVAAREVIREAL